jgi:hypothetical protein
VANVKGGAKAPPAKAAAKPTGKSGATAESDKNAPKSIEIEYQTDVASEQDFILLEKTFNQEKTKSVAAPKRG